MQFSMKRDTLKNALAALQKIAAAKNHAPMFGITGNVMLSANANEVILSATDLEIAVRMFVSAKTKKQGTICLPVDVLVNVVAALPAETTIDFKINTRSYVATLECGSNTTNIKGIGPESFPGLPTVERFEVDLSSHEMRRLIGCTAFAASKEDTRPVLTGVKFLLTDSGLTMVSADGFRLALVKSEAITGAIDTLIPARALIALDKGLASLEAELESTDISVQIAYDRATNKTVFRVPGMYELIVSPIEGFFPDYNGIIPSTFVTHATVETAAVQNALALQKPFACDSAWATRMVATDSSLTLSSVSQEKGDTKALLDAHVEGEPVNISVNMKYMVEGVAVLETDEAMLHFNGDSAPLMLTNKDRNDFLYIVMPMSGERARPTEKQENLTAQPEPEEEVTEEAVEA